MINIVLAWQPSLFTDNAGRYYPVPQTFKLLAIKDNRDQALMATLFVDPDLLILDADLPGTASIELIVRIIKLKTHSKILLVLSEDSECPPDLVDHTGRIALIWNELDCVFETIQRLCDDTQERWDSEPSLKHPWHKLYELNNRYLNLSRRETEILSLIAKGYKNRVIADLLNVNEKTVEYHINKILIDLSVANRTEAVIKAYRLGILSFEPVSTGGDKL